MKKILIKIIILIFVFTGIFVLSKGYAKNEMPVKIAFFGDSITELGWKNTNGYVRQTVTGLQKKRKKFNCNSCRNMRKYNKRFTGKNG